ncbi:MAG: 4Fe-4S dicluster domain-containing protein [Peptococcaceae bacterium]|nr:4Fe-4S dicluster domain-containing protein [Peptococcaceae bacterium]
MSTGVLEDSKGVLVDIPKCFGCRSCMVACKIWNDLPEHKVEPGNTWDHPTRYQSNNWTFVQNNLVTKDDQVQWRFTKMQCMHCNDPACAAACFTASFEKRKEGAVVYKPTEFNKDYCVGCRYCMIACPFGVPTFEWDVILPFVQKCRFCYDRMAENEVPACISACPSGCLTYGKRDDLVAIAKQRIQQNKNYIDHVYGEKEYGGTAWMYISDVPFEDLGFRVTDTERSIPSMTWDVLKWTPVIFVGWGAILTALKIKTKTHDGDHDEHYEIINTFEENKKEEE